MIYTIAKVFLKRKSGQGKRMKRKEMNMEEEIKKKYKDNKSKKSEKKVKIGKI